MKIKNVIRIGTEKSGNWGHSGRHVLTGGSAKGGSDSGVGVVSEEARKAISLLSQNSPINIDIRNGTLEKDTSKMVEALDGSFMRAEKELTTYRGIKVTSQSAHIAIFGTDDNFKVGNPITEID